jgi:predicted deacylase
MTRFNIPAFQSIHFQGREPGPKLIVTGAVHGNEVCGTEAIRRVIAGIQANTITIEAGEVTFVPVTNPLAYSKRERNGDRNLNRNLAPTANPVEFEDHVANWLCPLLARHDVLLDLHSTRAHNPAFAMLGPADNDGVLQPFRHFAKERALARHLGIGRFVDGWLATYAAGVERRVARGNAGAFNSQARYGVGTTEYMRSVGGYAITLECGQHDAPESPDVGYRAICNTLAFLGLTCEPAPEPAQHIEMLHMYDVIDRLHAGDVFAKPWVSFAPVKQGEVVATRHDGTPVVAPADGCTLFPDANAPVGSEWLYLARVDTF